MVTPAVESVDFELPLDDDKDGPIYEIVGELEFRQEDLNAQPDFDLVIE